MKVLIELRNALTHFKPEWMDEADDHAKMSAKLSCKIDGSPFLRPPNCYSRGVGLVIAAHRGPYAAQSVSRRILNTWPDFPRNTWLVIKPP